MAWADGLESSVTTTSTLSAGMQTYYDKRFLRNAVPHLHMMQFGQKRPLPAGSGKTIQWFRYNDIDTITTKLTEGTNPAGTLIAGHNVNRTVEEWGAWNQNTSLVSKTHIDRRLKGLSALWGKNAGKTVDLRIMKEVVTLGAHSMSADAAAAACGAGMRPGQWAGSVDGDTASTASVIYANTGTNAGDIIFGSGGSGATDDWLIGGQITFTSGANYGQSRYVYDSAHATFQVNVYPAFEAAPAADDTFIFSHPGKSGTSATVAHALAATDILDHKVFARALEDLQTHGAPTFAGGNYVFILGPTTNAGFMTDTDGGWMGLAQYRGQELYRGEIGRYMGFRVIQTSQPFRCPLPTTSTAGGPGATSSTDYSATGTNYAANGAGHYSLAFGQEAYGVTLLAGMKTPKIIVKEIGSAGAADPLNMQGSIGWKLDFVPAALNACWCVSVVSGG